MKAAPGLAALPQQPAAPAWLARLPALRQDIFRRAAGLLVEDRLIYAVVGLYAVAASAVLVTTGTASAFAYLAYLPTWPFIFFVLFPFIYLMLGILQVVHRLDSRRSLAFRGMLSAARLGHVAAGLLLLAAMMVFQGTFTSIKNALPIWRNGFPQDRAQADLDALLHLGRDPWLYLHDIAGNGVARAIVEWNYNQGWFIVCFSALFWVAVSREARSIRTRYFLCYLVCWIVIGNVLAGLFLSAGPAFYGHVTGDTARFGALMAFLDQGAGGAHSAVTVQHYLWSLHNAGTSGIGSGISAFPSMHVSLVTLNALFLFEHRRRLGLAAFAYVAFVVASSVYLGWHYAIDGYAAIAVTAAIYLAIRRLMVAAGEEPGRERPAELKAS